MAIFKYVVTFISYMFIEIRKVGKDRKYYAVHSFREEGQVVKIRKYLGANLSLEALKEKETRALELTLANNELEKAQKSQREYIQVLKEMMFMTSHELRQPVVQILGLSSLVKSTSSHQELIEITELMKQAAETLDGFTRELTTFIHNEELKAEKSGYLCSDETLDIRLDRFD